MDMLRHDLILFCREVSLLVKFSASIAMRLIRLGLHLTKRGDSSLLSLSRSHDWTRFYDPTVMFSEDLQPYLLLVSL